MPNAGVMLIAVTDGARLVAVGVVGVVGVVVDDGVDPLPHAAIKKETMTANANCLRMDAPELKG